MPAYLGDLQVRGTLTPDKFNAPAKCITNAAINDDANLEASKLQQQVLMEYASPHGTAVAAYRGTIGVVRGASGKLFELHISMTVKSVTGAKVQVMIKKNNVDMLAAALELDDGDANYAVVTTDDFVAEDNTRHDHFEVVVTPVAGGGTVGQGLRVTLVNREWAQ